MKNIAPDFSKKTLHSLSIFSVLLFFSFTTFAQLDTPCECTQRWSGGGTWDLTEPDLVDDSANAPDPNGVIACANAAGTMSNIVPLGCTYNSAEFLIDIETAVMNGTIAQCTDPSTGNPLGLDPVNPVNGQPIVWLNFDVRAYASDFEVQINENNSDITWALYAAANPNHWYSRDEWDRR